MILYKPFKIPDILLNFVFVGCLFKVHECIIGRLYPLNLLWDSA